MNDRTALEERILDLQYCDFCGRSEVDEIINTRGNAPLIQMTSDDDLTICVACREADTITLDGGD